MPQELVLAIDDCIRAVEQLKKPSSIKFIIEVSDLIAACFKNACRFVDNKQMIIFENKWKG